MRYRETGVNLDQQDQFIELIKRLNCRGSEQIGPFAALFDLADVLKDYEHPLLISAKIGRASCRERVCQYV